jgi:hypothetical protein
VEGDDRRLVGLIARKDLLQLQRMRMHQETQRSSGFHRPKTGSQLRPS